MDKQILKGYPLPKEWMNVPTEGLVQYGIQDVEDTLAVLGAYINRQNPNLSCIVYSYGEDYGDFLDQYLGMIYDNNTGSFLPAVDRPRALLGKDIVNVSSTNQKYGKHNFMVHIFKTIEGKKTVGYSVQFFVVFKGNLINFTLSVSELDESNPYTSLINKNAVVRKFIIEYLSKL